MEGTAPISPETLWVMLAELFFLDTEPGEADYARAAALLQQARWTRNTTRAILTDLIAPVAGENLGYLVFPVPAPAWSGFDADKLCTRIRRLQEQRAQYPRWYFMLQDWNSRRMLKLLGMEAFLERLPSA